MTRLALAALVLALLGGCGGGGDKTVAEGGGQQLTQQQADPLVQHFRRERQSAGKDSPREGPAAFVQLRTQLLGRLVYRPERKRGAEGLGVTVSDEELSKRLATAPAGGEESGDTNGDTYARDSAE